MFITVVFWVCVAGVLCVVNLCWLNAGAWPGRLRTKVMMGRSPSFQLPWPMTVREAAAFMATVWVIGVVVIATGLWAGHALFGRSPLFLVMGGLAALLVKVTAPWALLKLAPKDLEERRVEFEQQEGLPS